MTAPASGIGSIHVGLVRRVGIWAFVVWALSVPAAATADRRLAWGVVLGGGAMLALFALYRWLAPGLLRPGAQRRFRVLFWLIWLAKWPVLGAAFYFAFRTGFASAAGIGLGLAIVPGVATLFAVWALLSSSWCEWRSGGAAS